MSEQTGGAESTSEDAVLRYDRDDMMRIMKLPISCTRPAYLSEDFNGDDGKFSPYKWLEHKWETEPPHGKRTQVQKLVDNVREEDERPGAVLSPQRRGFSSGCKPQDELANEEEWQDSRSRGSNRLGGGLKNWRGGASGGGNTATATNGKGPQQNAKPGAWKGKESPADQNRGGRFNQNNGTGQSGTWGSTGSSWRTAGDDRSNRNNRDQRGQMRGNNRGPHDEKLPEWADDGPASVNDLIELRGFDEPKRNRNKDKKDGKDSKEKNADTKKDQKSGSKKDKESTSRPDSRENAPVHIPDSDAEFAAIMGLIDKDGMNNISKPAVPDENVPTTGSRLSRFFNKGRSEDKGAGQSTGVDSSEPAPGGSAVFAKLFGNKNVGSPQTGSTGNSTPLPAMPMMRLEDVENQMRTQNQQQPHMPPVQVSHAATVQRAPEASRAQETGKGNPLQDPQEQALLMQKLSRFQRQQEGPVDGQIVHMPAGQNSQGGSPPPPPPGPTQGGAPYMMPPGNGPIPPPAQILARLADPQFAAAIINANYTKAMMEASAACGGGQVPAHIQESIKQAAVQSLLHQRQQMMVLAQLGKLPGMPGAGMPGVPNGPQQQAPVAQQSRATSLIPASVQRAMSKNAANQQPRQHTPDFESEEAAMAAAAGQKEQMAKKLAMQQQYAAMMSAMQGGLSMAAWRPPPPQSGGSQPQQPQTNQQPTPAQIAQMQQLAQLARHQQMLAAAAAAQQQQQQAQRMHAAQQQHKYRDESSWQSGVSEGGASLQNPLEKLLASAGARPMVYHGEESAPSDPAPSMRLPDHARPISLEELERRFTESK